MTSGLPPIALTQAHADWVQHLLLSPDKQIALVHKAALNWARFFSLLLTRLNRSGVLRLQDL